ncbi:MAG: DNA-3-methyladenine glycosylase [Acidimicrobiales bacterium]
MRQCERQFFERHPDAVARDLIGSLIVVRAESGTVRARVVETEAYGGEDDSASHAFRGPTPRSAIMFGPAGYLYVYLSYGMHWCMNVVTGTEGTASAVLLRAAQLLPALDGALLDEREGLLRGPGLLTRGLGITGEDNGIDCCSTSQGRVSFLSPPFTDLAIARSARIGISASRDRLSRYFLDGHPGVSRTSPRIPSA